jgi:hypothetical protein
MEKAQEEVALQQAQFAREREYLNKERDKAFALLDEARHAQLQLEQALEPDSLWMEEFGKVEQRLRDEGGGQAVESVQQLLAGLKAQLGGARQRTHQVALLDCFKLSTAEKLLTRNKYELSEEPAPGTVVSTLVATDRNVDRVVLMKIVTDESEGREATVAELIAEAKIIGRLDHPNIQPLYELSVDENGRAYYSARAIEGTRLSSILDDLNAKRSNAVMHYDLKRLLTIFHAVCDAVAYAHTRGVGHGRLSADCVSVGDFGEVLVTGWEAGKYIHEQSVNAYEDDVRADLLKLADLLHHLLTLVPPTPGDKKLPGAPHPTWSVPKGLWNMTRAIRTHRGSLTFTNVKQLQEEVEEFRLELGPRGGRAGALEAIRHRVQNWQ